MVEHIEKIRHIASDGTADTETRQVIDRDDTVATERTSVFTAARLIWFVADIILVLLAFRFVFVLLGANSANAFANFIYTLSHPFAAPFFGLFSYQTAYGTSRFEISTLVAMAVYALVAYGLARLVTIRHPREY